MQGRSLVQCAQALLPQIPRQAVPEEPWFVFEHQGYKLSGILSSPQSPLSHRDAQFLYVNNRFIKQSEINNLLDSSFIQSLLRCSDDPTAAGRPQATQDLQSCLPGYFLLLTCPTSDVHVGPESDKSSVTFKYPDKVVHLLNQMTSRVWIVRCGTKQERLLSGTQDQPAPHWSSGGQRPGAASSKQPFLMHHPSEPRGTLADTSNVIAGGSSYGWFGKNSSGQGRIVSKQQASQGPGLGPVAAQPGPLKMPQRASNGVRESLRHPNSSKRSIASIQTAPLTAPGDDPQPGTDLSAQQHDKGDTVDLCQVCA